jgi:hypothetical protein
LSKEIAQTIGGKRFAWLLAIIAAFAVMAAVGSQWRQSEAAIITGLTLTSTPASGTVLPGQTVIYTASQPVDAAATAGTLSITLPPNVTYVSATCTQPGAGTPTVAGATTVTCTFSNPATAAGNIVLTVNTTVNNVANGTNVGAVSASTVSGAQTDSAALPAAHLTVANVTGTGPSVVVAGSPNPTYSFTIPVGLDVCGEVTTADNNAYVPVAGDFVITGGTFVSATTDGAAPNVVTVTVAPTGPGTITVAVRTHLATSTVTTDCVASTALSTRVVVPVLRHIADSPAGAVIAEQEVNNNVRGSTHTICTVDPVGNAGLAIPGGITLTNIVVTPGGGYLSTIDTDPTFTDVSIFTGNGTNGPLGATCISWRSLDAGDQTINILYVGLDGQQYNVLWGTGQGIVKEWNRLEDSVVTLSGDATGTAFPPATVLTRTLPLVLNPVTGQYQGSPVTITDVFRGSHVNTAGAKEGPMPLAGVTWSATLAGCGTLDGLTAAATAALPPPISGATTLLNTVAPSGSPNTHVVGGEPNLTFNPNGCAPGGFAEVTIVGREPGAFGSGVGLAVTQRVRFEFATHIPAKHVFLAWAGQRVVLEHNWALDPTNPGGTCPLEEWHYIQYVKSSGPGTFMPGGTMWQTRVHEAQGSVTWEARDPARGRWHAPCTSVAVFESQDQGQVDIEAWIEAWEGQGAPASKVAFVVYFMKFERVNLSLVTQVSKPLHNSSSAPDYAPGNPWDATRDDADGSAEWNVSRDILVRGRVSGWFTNSNPSGRPADTSDPLNVLPANRWVMPHDWARLAGGPADNADGSNAIGTAEVFRPYYDIMIDPDPARNGSRALGAPLGVGVTQVAVVAAGNTGTGTAAAPVTVTTCASLPAGASILVGASPAVRTVTSCVGTALVLTPVVTPAPAAGTPIFLTSGVPFVGPYSALDIVGLSAAGFGTLAPYTGTPFVRDTAWADGDVDMWDAPMPPALVSVAIRGTGFIKQVVKSDVYYLGTPNTAPVAAGGAQVYPNPFYLSMIPESPAISAVGAGGGYMWDSWGTNGPAMGPYTFWQPVRIGVNSAGIGDSLSATDVAELGIIRTAYGDTTIARDLVVYSDNHGEFMVTANGDFRTDLTACATNARAGGKHCNRGDRVGRATITAVADYPDFRGKHFPVASNAVTVDWSRGLRQGCAEGQGKGSRLCRWENERRR